MTLHNKISLEQLYNTLEQLTYNNVRFYFISDTKYLCIDNTEDGKHIAHELILSDDNLWESDIYSKFSDGWLFCCP